jgi:hypothetical protein
MYRSTFSWSRPSWRWVVSFTPLPLCPGKEPSVRTGQKAWWTPEPVWPLWRSENSWPYWDWNSELSAFHPVASRYTDWATAGQKNMGIQLNARETRKNGHSFTLIYLIYNVQYTHIQYTIIYNAVITSNIHRGAISHCRNNCNACTALAVALFPRICKYWAVAVCSVHMKWTAQSVSYPYKFYSVEEILSWQLELSCRRLERCLEAHNTTCYLAQKAQQIL